MKAALKTYDRWVPPVIETKENGSLLCVCDRWGRGVSEREARNGLLTGRDGLSGREGRARLSWAGSLGFGPVGLADYFFCF